MIKEIENFRTKYPEYDDMDDITLAEALAKKYPEYSDLPAKVSGGEGGFLPHLTRGISKTLGAPADVLRAGANLIPGVDIKPEQFGSRAIELGLGQFGAKIPAEKAELKTASEYIGRSVGEIAGLLLPGGVAIKGLAGTAGLTGKIAQNMLKTMGEHPYLTMMGEITAGIGAGAGRYFGEEKFESPVAKSLSELLGGIGGAIAPTLAGFTPIVAGARLGKQFAKKALLPFTEVGAKYRAGTFLKKQVSEPAVVAGKLIEQTISEMPYTVATGEKRLVSLLQGFRNADVITDADFIEKTGRSLYKLQMEMRAMGLPSTEILREVTEKRIASLTSQMDKRILKATNNAQNKLNVLTPAKRKANEAIIVRDELQGVMRAEKIKNDKLWADVPKETKVDFINTKTTYDKLIGELPAAQRGDVPYVLRNSFIAKPPKPILAEAKTTTTVNELWGLRSKLLETSRISKSTGKFNQARIANDMADTILDDLGAKTGKDMTEAGQKLNVALSATRKFEERFHRGITGKILGYERTGAPAIAPELTLDISVGRAGLKGAVDMNKVVVTPEAVIATKRYLTRSFVDYSTDKTTGMIIPTKAQTWMKNNEQILDGFPELRTSLSNSRKAQILADNTKVLMETRKARLRDPKISYASRLLNTEVGKEVESALGSKDSVRMTAELMKFARNDPTAIEGLKGAFVENILEKSSVGAYNEIGEQVLSGKAMNGYMNKHLSSFRSVFSQQEIVRMRQIANELAKIELSESKLKGVDINLEDIASNFLRIVSRVGGAQIGRVIARMTGGGTVQTPGIFSERFKNLAGHLSKDRAFQMVHDAIIKDPELLRTLLLPIDKPLSPITLKNLRTIDKTMNLWLGGIGSRVMEDIMKEIEEETNEIQ